LADIASYLTEIFEFKKKFLTQGNKLAQSNITLQNIQAENDRLDNEIIDLTSRYNDSVEKKNQLRAELDKALKEIDSMRTSQPQKKGLPE
jgi:peptidoglycan hydrolase CwlO-like protein